MYKISCDEKYMVTLGVSTDFEKKGWEFFGQDMFGHDMGPVMNIESIKMCAVTKSGRKRQTGVFISVSLFFKFISVFLDSHPRNHPVAAGPIPVMGREALSMCVYM